MHNEKPGTTLAGFHVSFRWDCEECRKQLRSRLRTVACVVSIIVLIVGGIGFYNWQAEQKQINHRKLTTPYAPFPEPKDDINLPPGPPPRPRIGEEPPPPVPGGDPPPPVPR